MWVQFGLMALGGVFTGMLAGFLGIGGGTVLVPLLLLLGYSPIQAVATSSLAIAITACSGTLQNWRMGVLRPWQILLMGLPALVLAQAGVGLASSLSPRWLLVGFGGLMLLNIALFQLRQRLSLRRGAERRSLRLSAAVARGLTGGLGGLMAGLFGVGGGAIMVPLQILLLGDPIKRAIQTSLGVIVMTAIAATIGHGVRGNVVYLGGFSLGVGGLFGAQVSTRFLPKLPDEWIAIAFRGLLLILAGYSFWRALQGEGGY